MSVASALTDIANSLSTLLTQINAKLSVKGVSTGASDMAEVPDKINAIVTGSGIDTSDATAGAGDIRSGKTAYADGAKLTGTLVPGIDTSDATATESDILSGKTAYVDGTKVTGNITTVTKAKPTISVNTSTGKINASYTQSAGAVTAGTVSADEVSLTTKAAETITPGTTDQTIPAGRFLTGAQTIKGDSDLKASNIKNGVTIFNVTGTYEGSSSGSIAVSGNKTVYRSGGGMMTFSGLSAPSGKTLIGVIVYCYAYSESNTRLCSATLFANSNGTTGKYFDFGSSGVMYDASSVFTLTLSNNTAGTISASGISFDSEPYYVCGIYA